MKALVVYESMYGNTRHIAEAIAEGLRWSIPTDVVLAHDAGALDLDEVELVVAGAPTHAWGLSRKTHARGRCVGEIDRANQWGEELGRIIAQVTESQLTRQKSGR